MTALAHETPRAIRFDPNAHEFEAFSLGTDDKDFTSMCDPLQATTLQEALGEVTLRWSWDRGHRLGIREIGPKVDKLHVYAVRRSSQGIRVWRGHVPEVEMKRWLEHIATIDLNIIAGIDVVGVGCERELFEHRQANRPERARLRRVGR